MVIFNSTFFFPPHMAGQVRPWIGRMWMPAARAAGSREPVALAMDPVPGEEVERIAVHATFSTEAEAQAFAAREAALLTDEMASTFGRESVLVFHTLMRECVL